MKAPTALIACLASTVGLAAANGQIQFDDFGYAGPLTSNGWVPWCGSLCAGVVTSTAQFVSAPRSAQIGFCTDVFYPTPGVVNTTSVFVVGTFVAPGAPGKIRLSLVNKHTGFCTPNDSAVVELDGASGVVNCKNTGATVPLVTGAWVELRVQIDFLNTQSLAVTYNGNKFVCNNPWTNNGSTSAGAALACEGLRIENSTPGSTGFYYVDDVEFWCAVDVNRDGALDFFDYDEWTNCFTGNGCGPYTDADFNGDCVPDFFDFFDFMNTFQNGC